MNPTRDYIEKQKAICRDEWFKNHKATLIANPEHRLHEPNGALIINWQNPESWNYGCRFIIHRRWLCVVGDIGEAVYEWGQDVTLPFLSQLDFSYFHGKCQASESGRKFEGWDGDVANADRLAFISTEGSYSAEYDKCLDRLKELSASSGKDEYEYTARECYDICGDGEYASNVSSFGIVPCCRAIGHFVGLQMAIKQLTNPLVTVTA